MDQAEFNIASVVVVARPGKMAAVRQALCAHEGVEVHAESDDGRMVVTVEGDRYRGIADTLFAFNSIDGVITVELIYQHSEPVNGPVH